MEIEYIRKQLYMINTIVDMMNDINTTTMNKPHNIQSNVNEPKIICSTNKLNNKSIISDTPIISLNINKSGGNDINNEKIIENEKEIIENEVDDDQNIYKELSLMDFDNNDETEEVINDIENDKTKSVDIAETLKNVMY